MRDRFEVQEGDVGFLRISKGDIAKTIEPCDNILIDLDVNGAPLSIEVVGLSHFSDDQIIEAVAPVLMQGRLIISSSQVSSGLNTGRMLAPEGTSFRRDISKESATCGV